MPIEYKESQLVLRGDVGEEEAPDILVWLKARPTTTVDLRDCTHLHAANLQVLMATQKSIAAWPDDPNLRVWLEMALQPEGALHRVI